MQQRLGSIQESSEAGENVELDLIVSECLSL